MPRMPFAVRLRRSRFVVLAAAFLATAQFAVATAAPVLDADAGSSAPAHVESFGIHLPFPPPPRPGAATPPAAAPGGRAAWGPRPAPRARPPRAPRPPPANSAPRPPPAAGGGGGAPGGARPRPRAGGGRAPA